MSGTGEQYWTPVPGHDGYQVSNLGGVRSVDRTVVQLDRWGNMTTRRLRGKVLSPGLYGSPLPGGGHRRTHHQVMLGKGNVQKVHGLVMLAFVGPCPDGLVICHANDVGTDNRLANVRYDTRSANKIDAVRNGLHWQANKTHCKHGHEFTPENTIVRRSPNGRPGRGCRACQREKVREAMRRRRRHSDSS